MVVAEHQTAGRGRLDRSWETPPRAALTFSVLLRPTVGPAQWPWLPLLTGYAVAGALRDAGFDAGVKWPNDVLVGDLKVAGILVERVDTPTGPAAVLGVGLNVSTTAEELPVPTATSLALAAGDAPTGRRCWLALLRRLREEYDAWQGGGRRPAGVVHPGLRDGRPRRARGPARRRHVDRARPPASTPVAG